MELTNEQEIELIDKHKEEFFCPKCDGDLYHKDHWINLLTLLKLFMGSIFGFGLAILVGVINWN